MRAKNTKLFFLAFSISAAITSAGLMTLFLFLGATPAGAVDVSINADVSALCGNNIREGSEVCDGSASSGVCYNQSCNSDCTCPVCGDGTIGAGETCENDSDCPAGKICNASCGCQGTGQTICTTTCGAWGACINGIKTRSCSNSCSGSFTQTQVCAPVCGNGAIEAGEECDDSNTVNGDGCSATCQLERGCGNGSLDPGEECDDNNTGSGDCCSSSCQIELLISNVSVNPITNNSATVNWVTRSWQGNACRDVASSALLEWGRTVSLSDGSASLSGSNYRHFIGGLITNTTYNYQITATLAGPSATLQTTHAGSFLTTGGVENCTNGLDDNNNGFCDYPGSVCSDGSVPGDPSCACQPDFLCTPGPCQADGLQTVTCQDQATPTCALPYQYQEGCNICLGVVCGGCQQLDPQTCTCTNTLNCCGNTSCEPPGEDPYSCPVDCPVDCLSDWDCGAWQPAVCPAAGAQTRNCFDRNACPVPINPPPTQQSCGGVCQGLQCGLGEVINIAQCICEKIVPFCGNGVCELGENHNACPQDCVEECQPNWTCLGWDACEAGLQHRECYDLNSCGLDLNRPPEVRSCQPGCDVACGVCQTIDLNSCSCAPVAACCGNRVCETQETNWSCAVDCGIPPSLRLNLPACLDGLDNDQDGLTDYPADPGCKQPSDQSERNLEEIINEIAGLIGNSGELFRKAVLDNPLVESINDRLATPILISTVVVNTFSMFSFLNFLSYLRYLFTEPLAFLARRRRQKWGVVYNAITKEPVDLAIVRLYRKIDGRLVRSQVTDKQGRFSFIVSPDRYYLTVTKPRFNFPTALLKDKREDVKYLDLYHGEPIEVRDNSAPITVNIPLDPFEDTRPPAKLIFQYYLRKVQYAAAFSAVPLAALSFAISPSVLTLVLLSFHCSLYALFRRLSYVRPPKSWGVVYDQKNRQPIGLAITRIYDKTYNRLLESRVTDRRGRYAFLVDNNQYYLTAEKIGYQPQKTADIDLINKKKETIVNFDIALKRGSGESPVAASAAATQPVPPAPTTVPTAGVGRESLEDLMKQKALTQTPLVQLPAEPPTLLPPEPAPPVSTPKAPEAPSSPPPPAAPPVATITEPPVSPPPAPSPAAPSQPAAPETNKPASGPPEKPKDQTGSESLFG